MFYLGFETTVFVRDEGKIPEHLKDKVKVVVGDVTNAEQVAQAIAGKDGVAVVLGTRNNLSMKFFYMNNVLINVIRI